MITIETIHLSIKTEYVTTCQGFLMMI